MRGWPGGWSGGKIKTSEGDGKDDREDDIIACLETVLMTSSLKPLNP